MSLLEQYKPTDQIAIDLTNGLITITEAYEKLDKLYGKGFDGSCGECLSYINFFEQLNNGVK